MEPILRIENLGKRFSGFQALQGVSFELRPRELKGIFGPNGAGKSTLFNVIAGLFPPSEGRIIFKGKDITGKPAEEICQAGIAKTFQIVSLFPHLTVLENVRLAAQGRRAGSLSRTERTAREVLGRVRLESRWAQPAGTLSHGEQRVLDIAIALASDPEVLLLDEPTAGMSPVETQQVSELIRELAREHAILMIEHDIDVLMTISDTLVALHQGRLVAEGGPKEITDNRELQAVYFGTDPCS